MDLAPMTSPSGLRSPVTRCFCHGHHGVSALPTYLVRLGGRISEEELKKKILFPALTESSTVAELMCPSSAASRFQKSALQDRYFSKAQRRTHRTWLSCRFTWCHTSWPKSQIPTNTRHNSDGENKKSCCVTLVQRGDGGFCFWVTCNFYTKTIRCEAKLNQCILPSCFHLSNSGSWRGWSCHRVRGGLHQLVANLLQG